MAELCGVGGAPAMERAVVRFADTMTTSQGIESSTIAAFDASPFDSVGALRAAMEAAREGGCRVVVVVGLEAWQPEEGPSRELREFERFPLPLVAAIEGELSLEASDLALACDIRVAAAGMQLRVRFGSRRLLQLVSVENSIQLIATRGRVDAATALEMGLVSRLAPAGLTANDLATSVAATIASRGPIATQLGKEALWRGLAMPFEQALRFETDLTLLLQTTKDRAEGVRAFLEKRQPVFTGE